MQKRGWVRSTDDAELLEKEVLRFYGAQSVEALKDLQLPFAARMAAGYEAPNASVNAWVARAKTLARAVSVSRAFTDASFADCLARLRLLLNDAEEARHIPRVLAEHGIRFLVVEHLPRTRIDGACLWLDGRSPIVALSMRYERLDWFWFTVMHEMGHVSARDGISVGGVVDNALVGQDCVARSGKPESEAAADRFSENFLIPTGEMDNFIARIGPLYSKDRIRLFAKRINVHPAIVVGQLQFRKEIEYYHSRDVMRDKLRAMMTANAVTDGWGHVPLSM